MGQTLTSSSLSTGRESPSLSSPSTPDPEFANTRVVISQELLTNGDESSASSSSSTPGEDIANKGGNTASKAPMMMEAFLKTFEQLAVQQWPTWAKRRGWITDYSDESSSSEILPSDVSVENCETVLEGRLRAQAFDQEKTSSTSADLKVNAKDGQDPDLVGDSDDQRVNFESPCGNVAVPIDSLKVPAEGNRMTLIRNNHKASSEKEAAINLAHLYEMSLRWIFEPEVLSEDAAFDDFPLERAGLSVHEDLSNTSKEEFNHQAPTTIRIYIRLLRKSGTEISFIDFRPSSIPSTNLEEAITSASHNYEPKEKHYFVELNNDESKVPLSFPRDVSSTDLILKIVSVHPMLNDCKAEQLAVYEKCWLPGRTSRARLRRLNELERPFLLASQWSLDSSSPHGEDSSTVPMARALVLQECQTCDISWGEFSLAELNNFMKVLEREEAGHEFYIRQKYQHLGEVLKLAIRAGDKPVVESHNRIVKIPQ